MFSLIIQLAFLILVLLSPEQLYAYIGPGAGFAFLGSTLVFVLAICLAIITLFSWPLQWAWRKMRGFGISSAARTRRVIILGLDGLEPSLADRYMAEGKLPNLKALKEAGCYSRLGTTLPALSPVAWSTFQTGVNPGAHNIFDFLTRDKRTCLPELASTETTIGTKVLGLFGYGLKLKRPQIRITRKSQPFWKVLGQSGIFSNIIRVPISYPPEKFNGNVLSAMCTPDLRGTQGTFAFYTTRSKSSGAHDSSSSGEATGGERHTFIRKVDTLSASLIGPPGQDGKTSLKIDFTLTPKPQEKSALLEIGGNKYVLQLNKFSDWVQVKFKLGFRKEIYGICRFCLRELEPEVSLYISPLNVDPEQPAMPISSPLFFSSWLAKRHGTYGTLGLMEDTWGRNEFALDDQRFLDQAYLTHAERERMFFEALEKTREGLCVCVFDASDRIQHMFWRYLDEQHPSAKEDASFTQTIPDMYMRMDQLVGKTRAKLAKDDVLFVISDHGFASFRRCVNLNTWLMKEGYLVTKNGVSGKDYFQDVDWSKTKAFAVGLAGLYINRRGRERHGIVSEAEFEPLQKEIARKLEALQDPADSKQAIKQVYLSQQAYRGVYAEQAPDLIVGYNRGYRVSWDSITGAIESEVFSDNLKAWSGDHHVDPRDVPGVFFSNKNLKVENPHLMDLAPTVLDLFAVKVPRYMEGRVIL